MAELSKAQREELPSTVARSDEHAQATWAKTHDSAVESYGEGERAHRTAFSALKHGYEKVGDHWEPKAEKGPSDAQAARTARDGNRDAQPTAGGVDANASKKHLYDVAKRLGVEGRSTMDKDELVAAIDKANRRETARARERDKG
jgi:cation transport regulator ChaB